MTTKQQQHVSRFLEASLLRQAEGKLKNCHSKCGNFNLFQFQNKNNGNHSQKYSIYHPVIVMDAISDKVSI